MVKVDELSPHQLMILKAAHYLRTMPLDYASVDITPDYDRRLNIHVYTREIHRRIASGESAIVERNQRIDLIKEFKRAKAKGDIRVTHSNSKSSDSTDTA